MYKKYIIKIYQKYILKKVVLVGKIDFCVVTSPANSGHRFWETKSSNTTTLIHVNVHIAQGSI